MAVVATLGSFWFGEWTVQQYNVTADGTQLCWSDLTDLMYKNGTGTPTVLFQGDTNLVTDCAIASNWVYFSNKATLKRMHPVAARRVNALAQEHA